MSTWQVVLAYDIIAIVIVAITLFCVSQEWWTAGFVAGILSVIVLVVTGILLARDVE